MSDVRLPPTAVESERALLGGILSPMGEPMNLDEIRQMVSAQMFSLPEHGTTFQAMTDVSDAGDPICVESVLPWLRQADAATNWAGTLESLRVSAEPANPEYYCREIVRTWGLRRVIRIADKMRETAFDPIPGNGSVSGLIEKVHADLNRIGASETTERAGNLVTTCIADVEPENVTWLWPSRFAVGKLNLLIGDPGLGKSLVSLDVIARVTTGRPWPDRQDVRNPVGDVLLLSCEDGIGDTIRPRLDSAGADVRRITVIDGVRRSRGGVEQFDLTQDVQHLEQHLKDNPGVKLLVVDPISAYLGSGVDANANADVRRVLTPLAALAARHRVCLLGVTHLNKRAKGPAIYRALGSIGFVGAARCVWLIGQDRGNRDKRFMVKAKMNLAADAGGLAFHIQDGTSGPNHPVVAWSADPEWRSADELLADTTPHAPRASDITSRTGSGSNWKRDRGARKTWSPPPSPTVSVGGRATA